MFQPLARGMRKGAPSLQRMIVSKLSYISKDGLVILQPLRTANMSHAEEALQGQSR
jgi:hypothetical protein